MGLFSKENKAGQVDLNNLPCHVAVIMDGNGRWAQKRGLPRSAGHKAGAETFRKLGTYCKNLGIDYLTVYAFSTENWKRPKDEVDGIMHLLEQYLHECIDTMEKDGNRLRFLGDLSVLTPELRELSDETNEISSRIEGFQANVCLNYGGRDEILHAARAFARDCAAGGAGRGRFDRGGLFALPLFMRTSRSRPSHPPGRGEAHQQLPFVAVRVQRVLLLRHALARLYRERIRQGAHRVSASRAPLRRTKTGETEMKQRWLVVIVGLPALLAVLLACPAWATMLVVCGIAGIAAYELLHTAGENVPADFYWGLVTSVVMQEIWLFWERASGVHAFPISTVTLFRWILVMGAFLSAVVYYGKEKPFTFHDVAVTIVGGIVFPAMYSCIFLLRMDENYGKLYVLAPFCVAFVGDALSMYFGMWFGKRKMAPHVSPHKTWAGAIGGPIGSALALVLLGVVGKAWLGYAPNYLMLILVGVVANIFGQLGDLSMSLVKREAGIKDYSHLFLTHGGMLDRFDSTLFIAPVVWAAVCGGLL